jgi:hypothetical protein
MSNITLQQARFILWQHSMILRKVDGEYQVKAREWPWWTHPGVHYTNDLDDAIDTGIDMRKRLTRVHSNG